MYAVSLVSSMGVEPIKLCLLKYNTILAITRQQANGLHFIYGENKIHKLALDISLYVLKEIIPQWEFGDIPGAITPRANSLTIIWFRPVWAHQKEKRGQDLNNLAHWEGWG